MNNPANILPVNNFYDDIAAQYNSHMSEADYNIRKHVSEMFKFHVVQGNILDFGGGTGLDLDWETNTGYRVFFLEPSVNMRKQAQEIPFVDNPPVFIEKQDNFETWHTNSLPFREKMDGILANFAVLNCIKNIESLFEKLHMVCRQNCILMATVLNTQPIHLYKNKSLIIALKSLLNKKISIRNNQAGIAHDTYLHTLKQYKEASAKYFSFKSFTPITNSDFALLILSAR